MDERQRKSGSLHRAPEWPSTGGPQHSSFVSALLAWATRDFTPATIFPSCTAQGQSLNIVHPSRSAMTTPGVRSASYNRPPDSSSSTSDEQVPHTFSSPEDILGSIPSFVSSLPFPENYLISYACFSSISDEDLCDNLDNARLLLLESNIGKNLEDSLLPYVSLKRGQESLWIFSIASPSNDVHLNQPASLKFNGLEGMFSAISSPRF